MNTRKSEKKRFLNKTSSEVQKLPQHNGLLNNSRLQFRNCHSTTDS